MSKENTNASIKLPGSGTGLDVARLAHVLDHRQAEYKYLWLLAILDEFDECLPQLNCPYHRIPRYRLAQRMLNRADSYRKLYGLVLGKQNLMSSHIDKMVPDDASIIDWSRLNLEERHNFVKDVTESVCIWTLRKFLTEENNNRNYKPKARKLFGHGFNEDVLPVPLYFFDTHDIFVPWQWCEYLASHNGLLQAWTCLEFEHHLKQHNPNSQGVFQMLMPQGWTSLAQSRILWQRVLETHPDQLVCPYRPPEVIQHDNHELDHFIPKATMFSDQPWNLVPTTPETRKSKSGMLPNLLHSLPKFLDMQEIAVWVLASHPSGLDHVKSSYQRDIFSGMNLTNLPSVDGKPVIRERLTSIIKRNHIQAEKLGLKPWQPLQNN